MLIVFLLSVVLSKQSTPQFSEELPPTPGKYHVQNVKFLPQRREFRSYAIKAARTSRRRPGCGRYAGNAPNDSPNRAWVQLLPTEVLAINTYVHVWAFPNENQLAS